MKLKPEPSRIRSGGTRVTTTRTAADTLAAFRLILEEGFSKINGLAVDNTTAAMVVKISDTVKPELLARWFAKVDDAFTKHEPAKVTLWWIDTYWKLTRSK